MKLLNVDTLEEARKKLAEAVKGKMPGQEQVDFRESLGRVLAEDIKSEDNVPGFGKSTVDGYAVKSSDTQGVTESIPVFLNIAEEIEMGRAPEKSISSGEASYVPTGGMLPEGADAVVMVEFCEKFDDHSIAVYETAAAGRNVISVGEDISSGSIFLKRGHRIRPQEIGVLASAGVKKVPVFRPWKITVISTGDELITVEDSLEAGKTRDINTHSVSASAIKYGMEVIGQYILADDQELLKKTIEASLKDSDVVVVSGGSSQGEKDCTADVLNDISSGGVFTHGIALKPGKPTILAYDGCSDTILAGLPGHPAAAMMVFELLIVWLYRKLMGEKEPKTVSARIAENVASAGGRTTCLMVSLGEKKEGIYQAYPVLGQSGLMTTLTKADGYTMIDVNDEGLEKGRLIEVSVF